METDTLKKTLLYFGIAVILGLLLALVPLITLAEFRAENHFDTLLCERSLSEKMNNLMEAYGLSEPVYSIANFEALGVCFAIALVVYLLFRRRI
jgi:hypothetical protein